LKGKYCLQYDIADDKAVVTSTQKELQHLIDNLSSVKKYGMKIDIKKTEVICISRKGNRKLKILIEGQHTVQVLGKYSFK